MQAQYICRFLKMRKFVFLFRLCRIKQKNGSCFFPFHPTLYIKQINDPVSQIRYIDINKEKSDGKSVETLSVSACISAHFLFLIIIYSGRHSLRTECLCGAVSAFIISRNCHCIFLFHNNSFLLMASFIFA